MHLHRLDGCAPAPLAFYLKALGILRLVSEQADSSARGWWDGERFWLATALGKGALEAFFLEQYEPTPFVSPWNKGSGFFQADDPGVVPLETSHAPRFQAFRRGIAASRAFLDELKAADLRVRMVKDETKKKGLSKAGRDGLRRSDDYKKRLSEAERRFKELKNELIPRLQLTWRGPHRSWLDTAVVLDDTRTSRFPALLGTGGNDGRLDFTNNFMQRLNEVFDVPSSGNARPHAAERLAAALWGVPVQACLLERAVGQFLPGMAGGANSVNGPDGSSLLNPFDFILMMEGCLLFRAHAVKRFDTNGANRAAAPFAVAAQAAGYASAGESDESARGEQWMPLWSRPMALAEAQHLFAEGRAQIGRSPVQQPLDMARAVARLGVARGIAAFQRFGYIERNGQSNLAVPIGRFIVRDRISPHVDCLDDLAVWLTRLRRLANGDDGAARLAAATKRLGDGAFDVAQRPDEPLRWQLLLILLGEVEGIMKTGSGFAAGPIPPLRPQWVAAADDGSAEFRLALAFALQAVGLRNGPGGPIGRIRRYWLPLEPGRRAPRFAMAGDAAHQRLDARSEVVIQGRDPVGDAIAMVERWMVEAPREGGRHLEQRPAKQASAHAADLSAWLAGRVDPDRTMKLARALMALDRRQWVEQPIEVAMPPDGSPSPDDAWACIRLALAPWELPNGRSVPCDPVIVRRLASGDAASAVALALRRLNAIGVRAGVRAASVPAPTARLWAAALAFPVSSRTTLQLVHRLDPSIAQESFA